MNATLSPPAAAAAPEMRGIELLRAYALEAKHEFLKGIRTPAASIPFLLLPVPLYLFFGVVLAGSSPQMRTNPQLADYIFGGWCTFCVMMPGLFGVGVSVAVERAAGLLKLKRAMPMPAGANLVAKAFMSMAFAALAVVQLGVAAILVGNITLSYTELAAFATVMIIGSIPFCAIGLFIGSHTSASAAPAIANLVFLPMTWLSGFFFPLPEFLRPSVVIWPAFHLNQLALNIADVQEFSFIGPKIAAAVLLGVTVFFGGMAVRRLARAD